MISYLWCMIDQWFMSDGVHLLLEEKTYPCECFSWKDTVVIYRFLVWGDFSCWACQDTVRRVCNSLDNPWADNGQCGNQQHHQDSGAAFQGEVWHCGEAADSTIRSPDDHDRSGSGRVPHQGAAGQLCPPFLAQPPAAQFCWGVHHTHCQGETSWAKGKNIWAGFILVFSSNSLAQSWLCRHVSLRN